MYPSYPANYNAQVLNVAGVPAGVEYEHYEVQWDWINPYQNSGGASDALMALVSTAGATDPADWYTPVYNTSNPLPGGGEGSIFTRPFGLGYGPWHLEISGPMERDPGQYYIGGNPLTAMGWMNLWAYQDKTWYNNITVKLYEKRDYLWMERFENGMPAGWTTGGANPWVIGNTNYTKGADYAMTGCENRANPDGWVATSPFVVPAGAEAVFDYCYYPYATYVKDVWLQLDISTDGGTTWTNLWEFHNATEQGMARLHEFVDISAYTGQNAMLRFWNHDQYNWSPFYGSWVDNFGVSMIPEPASLLLLSLGLALLRRR